MLCFDQESMNEMHLYRNEGSVGMQGFQTIMTGPEHSSYGAFCPAAGHQLGFNDLKIIEAAAFLRHIGGGEPAHPNFADALEFEKFIHAIARSATNGERVLIQQMGE